MFPTVASNLFMRFRLVSSVPAFQIFHAIQFMVGMISLPFRSKPLDRGTIGLPRV